MKRRIVKVVSGIVIAVWVAGCASTKITGEWKDPQAGESVAYNKVFVSAISRQENIRRQMEDAFNAAFSVRGVEGIASYSALPEAAQAKEEELRKAVKASGAQAALVVRMVSKENKVAISPGSYTPMGYYGAYHSSWYGFYEPPSVYQYDVVSLEAKLFDVSSEKLVWAVSTETIDPGKLEKELAAYTTLICNRLAEMGYLPVATK